MDGLKASPPDVSVLTLTPFSTTSIFPHVYKKLIDDPVADLGLGPTGQAHRLYGRKLNRP